MSTEHRKRIFNYRTESGKAPDPANIEYGEVVAKFTDFANSSYEHETDVPWYSEHISVKNVIVEDPIIVKSIAYWFYDFRNKLCTIRVCAFGRRTTPYTRTYYQCRRQRQDIETCYR